MAIKASIGLMLLRLTVKPIHRLAIYIVLVTTELFSAAFFLLFVFQCRPSTYFWTKYIGGEGSCINPNITVDGVYAYSAITCVGDWIYAILPCILVWSLQMQKAQKVFVALILAMGAMYVTPLYHHRLLSCSVFQLGADKHSEPPQRPSQGYHISIN